MHPEPMPVPADRLLDAKEAAERLGISRWWFGELVRRGSIGPCVKIGNRLRIRVSVLDAYRADRQGNPDDPYLTYDDVASYLGISAWTAGELVRHGEIPGRRIGRRVMVLLSDVDAFIARHAA
ncbi:helix-turn-helix domain-containing protein [Myceligenerans crystallogenes]|uniref:Helix-turn-helix domain-containing protein n=1 Tax=Myceligenerans crystallogenes TaxID=316335 RepID=A0ABP4ZLK6_9MICO